jgi:hypothetical protein
MNTKHSHDNSTKLILARALHIKDALQQLDIETKNAEASLKKSEHNTKTDILALENKYLAKRIELYNDLVQIENNLLNSQLGQSTGIDQKELIALSKEINLAETLKQRQATTHMQGSSRYLGLCSIGCDNCIYDCATCVSTCGLNGGSLGCSHGSPGITGTHPA